jgi:hypothetical protein
MPVADHSKVFGLSDLKVATLTGETPGTLVDVPGIRSCEVTITTDVEELRGDNTVISIVDKGQGADFSIEEGGFSMNAAEVIFGRTATDAGTTPNMTSRLDLRSTDSRPYFFLTGQAKDDAGGDVQVVLWKAKATGNVTLNFADENFLTPGFEGRAIGRTSDNFLATIIQHETAAALAVPA